ncbi:magnesium transporter NIPA2 [Daphnia magna]|uniref:Spichthyin n=2 Tax=Daphnia magna TaxID=35525 RepID=A0A164WV08_9CRUS|nr:magnesium transporter NIPA2 [Daphnia magna]KAK4014709.1 hypothetical protein OUZ56_027218 [Daphnia magna]KZS13604.1 Spichthyin [Daphnia magna]
MMETSTKDFVTGLSLAIASCFFIGSSFIIKKLGLLRLRGSSSTPAADGGFGYLRDWVWWTGLITMGLGEASNFAAYAFAPASLVTPLGALSILVSAVLAPKFLNEKLNLLGKIGCMLCMLGACIIVIHAPKEGDVKSVQDLNKKIFESGFLYYVLVVVALTMYSIKFIVPRYGKTNVAVYIFICSSIGSLSVMCCKGLGLSIRESISATEKSFFNKSFLMFMLALLICITIQMNYLNKALDSFNSNLVNPVHYIFFTSFVILASSILFEEWRSIASIDVFATLVGLSVVIIALFLISAFNDLQITLNELCHSPTRKYLNKSTTFVQRKDLP